MVESKNAAAYPRILKACRQLRRPPAKYPRDNDFVSLVVETVINYRLNSTIVKRAYKHFEDHQWDHLRTHKQLGRKHERAALALWGYRYGQRLRQLRQLLRHLGRTGVTNLKSLRRWARESRFDRDFEGRVKGLGFAVYKWLLIRTGIPGVKPDVHVKRLLRRATGREFEDEEAAPMLERAARDMGWKAHILDWAIYRGPRLFSGGAGYGGIADMGLFLNPTFDPRRDPSSRS